MQLSLLIPTIKRHETLLAELMQELNKQIEPYEGQVEILIDDHETDSTGLKRNRLLKKAKGKYLAFFDADDKPSENYINWLMEGIEKDVDCCSLKGIITYDGVNPEIFEHSIKYSEWKSTNNEIKHERYPNHLNCIKSSIAKKFKFPDQSWAEDKAWSDLVHQSGLIKTEHYIEGVLYHYLYQSNKN